MQTVHKMIEAQLAAGRFVLFDAISWYCTPLFTVKVSYYDDCGGEHEAEAYWEPGGLKSMRDALAQAIEALDAELEADA